MSRPRKPEAELALSTIAHHKNSSAGKDFKAIVAARYARALAENKIEHAVIAAMDEGYDPMPTVQNGDNRLHFNLGEGARRIPARRYT